MSPELGGKNSFENGSGILTWSGFPRTVDEADSHRVAERLIAGFSRGAIDQTLNSLRGPFALSYVSKSSNQFIAAIDRMGCEKLCFQQSVDSLIVGTSAISIAELNDSKASLDPQAFFALMYSHMVPSPWTSINGISKLGPAQYLFLDEGKFRVGRYWTPDFSRIDSRDLTELQREVIPTIKKAIQQVGIHDSIGTFLSGGLDSSTVTGALSSILDGPAKAFSVGFGVQEFDELEFARVSSNAFSCDHFTYEVTPDDIVKSIPEVAAVYDDPFGNSSAIPTLACARLAKRHGVNHLLAGDGGDEIFAGNERYQRQRIFEWYSKVPSPIRKHLLNPFAGLFDPEHSIFPLRKLASYIQQASIELPERFESWNLIYREGTENVFSSDFLSKVSVDDHFQHMRDIWEDCPSNDLLDQMLWYDWKFILADNDLRKVTTMCELAGVRVSYPMLSEDLIELSLKVPSSAKIQNGELRAFFKKSVQDFLPGKIITKTKHGFGLPFGQWLKSHSDLRELVFDSLDSLKQRNIFDREFCSRVADEHKEGHASYYGYAIWDLVSIEQWLQAHSDSVDTESLLN